MTELERLLMQQLKALSAQHEQQHELLSKQLQQQALQLQALSERVEQLTQLLSE